MAAVPHPRIQAKVSAASLLADLPIISDVDDMLRDGVGSDSVAKFIQETMGLMTNVSFSTLTRTLRERRESLPPPEEPPDEECPATLDGEQEPRSPGRLARNHYNRSSRGIERMLEVESLYLYQRDRIDWLMQQEKQQGVPYEKMPLEVASARELIRMHADLEREFGPSCNRLKRGTEIGSRSSSELGQRVQRVFENPESRHKVIDLVKRMKSATKSDPVELSEGS